MWHCLGYDPCNVTFTGCRGAPVSLVNTTGLGSRVGEDGHDWDEQPGSGQRGEGGVLAARTGRVGREGRGPRRIHCTLIAGLLPPARTVLNHGSTLGGLACHLSPQGLAQHRPRRRGLSRSS
jgi:hypothetical protein